MAYLKIDGASIKVFNKYTHFAVIFSSKLAAKFPNHTVINNYAIKLINDQQLPYDLIYSLGLVKLKRLKIYIKNNLANWFIRSSKSLFRALILFDKMSDKNLRLYIDYQGLNNLTIKNQ